MFTHRETGVSDLRLQRSKLAVVREDDGAVSQATPTSNAVALCRNLGERPACTQRAVSHLNGFRAADNQANRSHQTCRVASDSLFDAGNSGRDD